MVCQIDITDFYCAVWERLPTALAISLIPKYIYLQKYHDNSLK